VRLHLHLLSPLIPPPSLPYHPAPPCLALPCLTLLHTNELTTSTRTRGNAHGPSDIATRQLIATTTRSCPGCKRYIEKNGGCDHITCEYLLCESTGVMHEDWNTDWPVRQLQV
jgi:hypothetical protein